MSTTNSAVENGTDRSIDDDRLTRALTESMDVSEHAPAMYDIRHDDETYTVDVEGGSCQCKDHQYRGDSVVCKHVLAACIHHVYVSGVNTRLVARVVAATDELGCPHGSTDCNGPVALDDRNTIPCEDCIAVTPGHWTAYCVLTGNRDRLGGGRSVATGHGSTENVALADGGRSIDDRFRLPEDPQHVDEDTAAEDDERYYAGGTAENTTTDVDGDEVPARSESPDMGGGESAGPELL